MILVKFTLASVSAVFLGSLFGAAVPTEMVFHQPHWRLLPDASASSAGAIAPDEYFDAPIDLSPGAPTWLDDYVSQDEQRLAGAEPAYVPISYEPASYEPASSERPLTEHATADDPEHAPVVVVPVVTATVVEAVPTVATANHEETRAPSFPSATGVPEASPPRNPAEPLRADYQAL